MSTHTAIQWTDYTWSPWLGCRKVSPGCENCYITDTPPFKFRKIKHGADRVRTSESYWKQPLEWNRKAERDDTRPRVFPSLCDPFDLEVDRHWREDFLCLIDETPYLTWLLLTKRIEGARKFLAEDYYPNIWLGVSVEDQQRADERVPTLLSIPAKVRFLSVEPMLEKINLEPWLGYWEPGEQIHQPAGGSYTTEKAPKGPFVNWVIVGGESGRNARPCNIAWIRSIVEQCKATGVACFVKQLGSKPIGRYIPSLESSIERDLHKSGMVLHLKGGDPSEWPVDLQVREFPTL